MGLPDRPERSLPAPLVGAATSLAPLVGAGAGLALALAAGARLGAALALAVLLWLALAGGLAARAAARRSSGRGARIDPFTVGEPWRRFVKDAVQARNRFEVVVSRTPEGPLRDRLGGIGERVAAGVDEVWRIAGHGHALSAARQDLGPGELRRRLAAIEAGSGGQSGGRRSEIDEAALAALRAQLAAVERLETTIADAEMRLRLLDARLAEAAARGVELSVRAAGTAALDALGDDVEGVVGELEALRQGLEETGGLAGP